MNFIQGIILTVVFIFILIILQKIFLGREGCTLKSKPICENGTLSCDGNMWKCACDKCNLRYPNIPHPHRCDPALMPKNCIRATCINGEWKCRDLPISKIQSVLNPLKRVCDDENKPDCDYPVCINGEWKCLKNKEGGCNLSQKIVCVNEDEEPVCVNGNWVCSRDNLIMEITQNSTKGQLYLMFNDDFSNLTLDSFMVPINGILKSNLSGINNESGFQISTLNNPFPPKNNLSFTKFLWNTSINNYPKIGLDVSFFKQYGTADENTNVEIKLFMFNAETYEIIMYTQLFVGIIQDIITLVKAEENITNSSDLVPSDEYQWNFPTTNAPILKNIVPVGFCIRLTAIGDPLDPDLPFYLDRSYTPPDRIYQMVISR
jgi:hypothetical protein